MCNETSVGTQNVYPKRRQFVFITNPGMHPTLLFRQYNIYLKCTSIKQIKKFKKI